MAKRRKHRPSDPAEIARRRYEERRDPSKWGVDPTGLDLPSNSNVVITAATRTNEHRARRYDCFALLESRGSLSRNQVDAVRRLEDDIAARYGLEGRGGSSVVVDGGKGSAELLTQRMMAASDRLRDVLEKTGAHSACLLMALCEPDMTTGLAPANWRRIVLESTGERFDHGQTALVRVACSNLIAAYRVLDERPRKAA